MNQKIEEALPSFIDRLRSRLIKGETVYQDHSLTRSPEGLAGECEEELIDLLAWGFLLWIKWVPFMSRLKGADGIVPEEGLSGLTEPNAPSAGFGNGQATYVSPAQVQQPVEVSSEQAFLWNNISGRGDWKEQAVSWDGVECVGLSASGSAYQFKVPGQTMTHPPSPAHVWIPRSLLNPGTTCLIPRATGILVIPEWKAIEKGLRGYRKLIGP